MPNGIQARLGGDIFKLLGKGLTQGPASLGLGQIRRPTLGRQPISPRVQGPQFLSRGQQLQRGARAGTLGQRQGPVFGGKPAFSAFARASLRPGQSLASQIRQLTSGGQFGRARPAQGQRGTLNFGLLGKQGPASGGRFGTFGRAFGRLGNRGR